MVRVRKCSKCGNMISEGGSFCPFCGNIINDKVIIQGKTQIHMVNRMKFRENTEMI